MVKNRVITTEKEIDRIADEGAGISDQPHVTDAYLTQFDGGDFLVLVMNDESRHFIPKPKIERIADRSDEYASNIEITEDGLGLRWPELDFDLYVPELIRGVYGTANWMKSLGRRGGSVRSDAKARAARENGRKGGRPRKSLLPHRRTHGGTRMASTVSAARKTATHPTRVTRTTGLVHIRKNFAMLFGHDEDAYARELPRIA